MYWHNNIEYGHGDVAILRSALDAYMNMKIHIQVDTDLNLMVKMDMDKSRINIAATKPSYSSSYV